MQPLVIELCVRFESWVHDYFSLDCLQFLLPYALKIFHDSCFVFMLAAIKFTLSGEASFL